MKPFDIINTPLNGLNIIEASAGTGKTHAIAGLFLRLILEQELLIKEILVVTFTEAATEELRDRIRKRLKAALDVLTGVSQSTSGDELLEKFVVPYFGNARSIDILSNALIDFDEAAIYTIHGFCQRMLRENAFESNALFDTQLVADQTPLLQLLVDDFWRKHFYTAAPLFTQYAVSKKYSPDTYMALIRRKSIEPELAIVPVIEKPDIDEVQNAVQKVFRQMIDAWPSARSAVESILLNNSSLSRTKYKPESIAGLMSAMDAYLSAGTIYPLYKGFEKFTGTGIATAVKKNCQPPHHAFFDLCDLFAVSSTAAAETFEKYLLSLKRELFDYMKHALKLKKLEMNVRSFDDLLEDMQRSLKSGTFLAKAIRKKFKAALIDEFQDTDTGQYDIFSTLFDFYEHSLFLIGDPKQAIYRFRGADIFAYMKAAAQVDAGNQHTLTTNWRSEAGLINAVNTIFLNAKNQFVFDRIRFHKISPAEKKEEKGLLIDGSPEHPLHIWFIDRKHANKEDGTINKGSAEPLVAKAVAAEIVRLAQLGQLGKATISNRALCPGDIAVLVRKNSQARLVQNELIKCSMPSVLYGAESIFVSHEAQEVARVISSISEPGNESKLKAALATDMFGCSGNDLVILKSQQHEWEAVLARFHQYKDYWTQCGFMRMFQRVIKSEGVRSRLLSYRDGERRMTNLLHCAEVLHRAETEQKIGMESLIKWFSAQRSTEDTSEEDQIRLESDENAVKLITIHRSKGLEYPVVFCPFVWDSSKIKKTPFSFHDAQHDDRLTLDIGTGDEENEIHASIEELAENERLLYVALTRAKHRCYLVWGKINQAETAAPAYLFHQPKQFSSKNVVEELEERVKKMSYEEMLAEVRAVQNSSGFIRVSHLPDLASALYASQENDSALLEFRQFSGTINRDWLISSYSSLISDRGYRTDQPDYDRVYDITGAQQANSERTDIFSFPRGAIAGNCIHRIFEKLDFSFADPEKERELIKNSLASYGIEEKWQEVLWDMAQKVVTTPLDSSRQQFTLGKISRAHRLHELEFYFPLELITAQGLAAVLPTVDRKDFTAHVNQLGFKPVRGYMRGFVDMVFSYGDRFYIVDWKSNYLGNSIESYSPSVLQNAMQENYYILQYYIYAVALHRYLSLRKADYEYVQHFGGVYYIFVRGVDPQHGPAYGIYYDRPAYELICSLSDYFNCEKQ